MSPNTTPRAVMVSGRSAEGDSYEWCSSATPDELDTRSSKWPAGLADGLEVGVLYRSPSRTCGQAGTDTPRRDRASAVGPPRCPMSDSLGTPSMTRLIFAD